MPLYEGKVKVRSQQIRTVEFQARNKEEAQQAISRMGKVISFRKRTFSFDLGVGMSPSQRQIFFTRLSAMLRSKVGTSDALALLRDTFDGKIQEVSNRLLRFVESGDTLGDAFEKIGNKDFPEATVALIKAGSRSGETWRAIKDAAEFENQLAQVKKSAGKGLISAVAGLFIAGALAIVSTLYVGPKIMESDLIKAANKDGSINIDWINDIGMVTGYATFGILAILTLFWFLASVGRKVLPVSTDMLILKIPHYRDLVLSKSNFIVFYGLSLLVKSGVRIEEALRLSSEGAPKGALKSDLVSAMNAVKAGKQWPRAMKHTLHETDVAALMCATDREEIANTLDSLSEQYRSIYAQKLNSFVPVLNLIAALLLTIAGGLLFGQSVLPMLMATQGLLG